jgi:SNF2-related domain
MTPDACGSAYALLSCSLPLGARAGPEWPRGQWDEVDKVNEKSIFKSLAWLLEPIRHVGDNFRDWQSLGLPADFNCNCESCAPSPPAIRWVKGKSAMVPLEDPVQAGEYERRLKRRPSPFVTQLKLDNDGLATARIGINIPSLVHRALASLPPKDNAPLPTLSWRLDTDYSPSAAILPAQFKLLSNKDDIEHGQPPHFKIELRPEQLRSLTWMIAQESDQAPDFVEEEIAEAILDPMGWRAEGKAERPIRVLGGVLADQVGYGKTAITLGLVDCTQAAIKKGFAKAEREKGRIRTAATLIVVPGHLPKQWESETKKFLKSGKLKVIVLKTVSDLNKITIEDIEEADIVIASSSLQRSDTYHQNLSQFAGVSEFPTSAGRHFRTHLQTTMEVLKLQVDRLQDEGSEFVLNEVKAAEKRSTHRSPNSSNTCSCLCSQGRSRGCSRQPCIQAVEGKGIPRGRRPGRASKERFRR